MTVTDYTSSNKIRNFKLINKLKFQLETEYFHRPKVLLHKITINDKINK